MRREAFPLIHSYLFCVARIWGGQSQGLKVETMQTLDRTHVREAITRIWQV